MGQRALGSLEWGRGREERPGGALEQGWGPPVPCPLLPPLHVAHKVIDSDCGLGALSVSLPPQWKCPGRSHASHVSFWKQRDSGSHVPAGSVGLCLTQTREGPSFSQTSVPCCDKTLLWNSTIPSVWIRVREIWCKRNLMFDVRVKLETITLLCSSGIPRLLLSKGRCLERGLAI